MACCAPFAASVDQQFTKEKARQELDSYRRKGAGPTTRLLITGIANASIADGTLLDVGAGVGALTFELLERGVRSAVIVEASDAYAETASGEAVRRGLTAHIRLERGDFVEVAATIPAASIVTLDRVVCCYPLYEELLGEALGHAERALALSYPRDRWFVRLGMRLENALRRRRTAFRTFVHPPALMRKMIEDAGFALFSRSETLAWCADVFVRRTELAGGMRADSP